MDSDSVTSLRSCAGRDPDGSWAERRRLAIQSCPQHKMAPISRQSRSLVDVTAHRTRAIRAILLLMAAALMATTAGAQSGTSPQTQAPRPWNQNPNGIHVYIWVG